MRISLFVAAFLLTGCVSAPPEGDPSAKVQIATAPVAPPPAPAAPNGTAPPPPERAAPPRVIVVEGTATITAAVGAPCAMQVRPCSRGPMRPGALDVPEPGATRASLVVTWNATASATGVARIEVRPEEGEAIAEGEGESPLTFELPPGLPAETLIVFFEPATGNAIAEANAMLVLTLTYPADGAAEPT